MKTEKFELNKKSVGFIFNGVKIDEVTALFLVSNSESDVVKYLIIKESYINDKFYNILYRSEYFTFDAAVRTFESLIYDSEFDKTMSEK